VRRNVNVLDIKSNISSSITCNYILTIELLITIKNYKKKITSFMDELEFIHAIKYISPYASASNLFAFGKFCLTV